MLEPKSTAPPSAEVAASAEVRELRNRAKRLPRNLKRSELIAREIVREIAERHLEPGTALPHETIMMAEYGVGRASVREALRILEAQGLIILKSGRHGGPVLTHTGPEQLGQTLTLFLRMSGFTYGDLAEFMKSVSPRLAELAAMNPERERVRAALSASDCNPCALVNGLPAHDRPELGPHALINMLSGSRVLGMFADAVDALFTGYTWAATQGEDFSDIARRDHRSIADAVLAGDPKWARGAMAEHLEHIFEYCHTKIPGLFQQSIEWK